MKSTIKYGLLVIITFILILNFSLIFKTNVTANDDIDINIEIKQKANTAYVTNNKDYIVIFTGTISINYQISTYYEFINFKLFADAGDWVVNYPTNFNFSKGRNELEFTIHVNVPKNTSAYIERNLTVFGTWEKNPGSENGEIDPVTSKIFVSQYSLYCLESKVYEKNVYHRFSSGV